MEPRISVITLGVTDMERSVSFYRDGLGLPHRDDKPPVAYFELNGAWLALFPREDLAQYINVSPAGSGFAGMTLSCNVDRREAVDETMSQAEAAGARVVRRASEFRWGGYGGWFADPDGYLWEIVWNPRPFMSEP